MNIKLTLIALGIAGLALNAHAVTNPVVACATTTLYANVADPIKLAFAPDGTLYVGRGNAGDAVKIHRVAPGGSPVTEYGNVAIADPDAVGFDALGIVSGTPGAVLVGGSATGLGATISKINTNGAVTALFGGVQANMSNPGELIFDAAGRLYLTDSGSNKVFTTASSAAPTSLFTYPNVYTLAFDVSNRLAIGAFTGPGVVLYSTNGTPLGAYPSIRKAGAPIVAGPGGDFWGRELYSVSTSDELIRIDSSGNASVVGTGFDGFLQMAFGPDHALYVSYRDYDKIFRIAPVATPVPDHWWPADGNASNAISTAHGTIVGGVTYAAGRFGQAFQFDGIDSEVSFGTNAGNFGTGDFTVSYWMNTTNLAVPYVMSKWPVCGHSSFWEVIMSAGATAMAIDQDSAGNNYVAVGAGIVADNQWHHVAWVRRGVNLYGYRDAVLYGSAATNGVALISNTALLKAGSSPCVGVSGTVRYSGLLDEIKLYGCALSAAQIAESAGIPDPTRPTLDIAPLPGAVQLSWTTNATGYLLETNSALSLINGWGVLTSNYSVLSTNYVVTNSLGGATRFYRLRKP